MGVNSANSSYDVGFRSPTTPTAPRPTAQRTQTIAPRPAAPAPAATAPVTAGATSSTNSGALPPGLVNGLVTALLKDPETGSESWAGWGNKPTQNTPSGTTGTPGTPPVPITPGTPSTPIPGMRADRMPTAGGVTGGVMGMMGRGEDVNGMTVRGTPTAASANGNRGDGMKPSPMASRMSPTRLMVAKALGG